MKPRYPILSLVAILLITLIALPAVADDLDSAVASARGGGLPILSEAESIAVASARAQAATAGDPFHADITPLLGVCNSAGEVVGMGPNVDRIFEAFAASGSHWPLITSSVWTSMGTGQTRSADGTLYVSVVFCEGGAPAATTTTTTAPAQPTPGPAPSTTTTIAAAAPPPPASSRPTPAPAAPKLVPSPRELCPRITGEDAFIDMTKSFCIF